MGNSLDPLSYGISGASAIADGILNFLGVKNANSENLAIARENNRANLELYREQYRNSIEQWNRENKYNDPRAQLERLRAAGLNPSLTIGNNAAGAAGAASLPSASPMQQPSPMQAPSFNFSDIAPNLAAMSQAFKESATTKGILIDNLTRDAYNRQQLKRGLAEIRERMSHVKVGSQEAKNLETIGKQLALDYKLSEETYDARKQSFELQNQLTQANKDVMDWQSRKFEAEKAYTEAMTQLTRKQVEMYGAQVKASIDAIYSQIDVNQSNIDLNSKEGKLKIAQKFETEMRGRGVRLDNASKKKLLPYVVAGAKSEIRSKNAQTKRTKVGTILDVIDSTSGAASRIYDSATKLFK